MTISRYTHRIFRTILTMGLIILALSAPAMSGVRLPGMLSSSMVLQRNKPIKIWGWADKGEKVTVSFNGLARTAVTSTDGRWTVTFPAMKEGGPYTMTIQGSTSITIDDILIGDVWVCSGQSNMEWNVKNSLHGERETAAAEHPRIRLLTVPRNFQYAPVDDLQGVHWKPCSPDSVGPFSAVGYYFGRDVHRETQVPIGLVNTSWGGSNIEAWTSSDSLSTIDEFKNKVKGTQALSPEAIKAKNEKELNAFCTRFGLTLSKPMKTDDWGARNVDISLWHPIEVPGAWEHKGLGDMDGIVWFRTEVTIPAELCTQPSSLVLGKIDDSDRTYVNGTLVGETQMYNIPREYLVKPGTFTPGLNTIAVRIADTGGTGGFWSSPEDMKLVFGSREIPLAGSWRCRPTPEKLVMGGSSCNPNATPASLYNGMIHPLLNLPIRGVLWYQGESNVPKAYLYRTLFPLMITCWREKWKQPELPFLFVQLANYTKADQLPSESDWAELREAQTMALRLPGTGMAVTIDIGDAEDIHPRNKQDVGRRLALNALKVSYGKDVIYSGPVYKSMHVEENSVVIKFVESRSHLTVKDRYGYLKGFAIAGADRKFHWARARLQDNRVTVSSPQVKKPVAVRYAWGNNPDDANLYNQDNLPALPFRTDDWPGITGPGSVKKPEGK